ncbi:MAG: hypothetical protein QW275_01675, partial [Candidatus Anstonellaceae archaeon]
EAQKKLSLASKTKEPKQKMEQINESYTMLLSAHRSLSDTIENLRSSAESSLRVAKIALAEVQEKAPQQDEFAIQIKSEVDKAEEALLNYQYADSLKASDRAISAANAFLSSKRQDIDVKTILLAAISLAFILVAAYYFAFGSKKKGEKEKRAVPKSAP